MVTSWLVLLCATTCLSMYSPYAYQSDPRASVPLGHDSMSQPLPYFNRMIGEEFFKQESSHESHEEAQPYTVIQDFGNYEKRHYPEVNMVCTHHKVDTAGDSLAGLERVNPWTILQSRRFQKTPNTVMFRRLFRYISGVNQQGEEIEMTTPVSTLHKIIKEDRQGEIELHMMCFYLPEKYQTGSQVEATARQAPVPAPQPMEDSLVILHTRPSMTVYVREFGGFALTHNAWDKQKEILLGQLIGKKYHDKQYFTVGYDSPLQLENRRNEVWVQDMEGNPEDQGAILTEELVEAGNKHHDS